MAGYEFSLMFFRMPDSALLVAAEPQAHAPMGAELLDQPDPPLGVAKSDETLPEQLQAHRRAVRLRQLLSEQHRQPVAPEELPDGGPPAEPGQQFVAFGCKHGLSG